MEGVDGRGLSESGLAGFAGFRFRPNRAFRHKANGDKRLPA